MFVHFEIDRKPHVYKNLSTLSRIVIYIFCSFKKKIIPLLNQISFILTPYTKTYLQNLGVYKIMNVSWHEVLTNPPYVTAASVSKQRHEVRPNRAENRKASRVELFKLLRQRRHCMRRAVHSCLGQSLQIVHVVVERNRKLELWMI